ncbi:MAG TPA: hypothetical protein VNL14_08890 [Candidatus Acidoferrales bacterium]|nr:hypothetical protein [Candidatus Acidoferrales bacterium]
MKFWLAAILACVFLRPAAFAAEPKAYQVTGPVLELKDDLIVVQKGTEKWEIGRDKDTKVKGDLKVGAKVTVHYRMRATTIEVKDEAKKASKPEPKKGN